MFLAALILSVLHFSHLLAMTLAEEDEKRYEKEKEWEEYKAQRLGAGSDGGNTSNMTELVNIFESIVYLYKTIFRILTKCCKVLYYNRILECCNFQFKCNPLLAL